MSISRPALSCALAAGVVASTAVAYQRVGLALSFALLLVVATGALAAGRPTIIVLAAALALQPVLRDAGRVVAVDVAAAVLATAVAVGGHATWPELRRALLRLFAGTAVLAKAARGLVP